MSRVARRSHLMYMARLIETARLRSPNSVVVEEVLRNANLLDGWLAFVDDVYRPYIGANVPDNVSFCVGEF